MRDIAKVKVQSVQAGTPAPDFEATTLDGKPFKLSDLRGKVVLVDFWATWCVPCVAELPRVKALYEKFGGDHFAVVGISFDSDAATARKFTSAQQLPWTQIWAEKGDEGPIAGLYGVGGIPATFLVGADGKVIERDLRGDELTKAVARETRKLAGGGTPPDTSPMGDLVRRVLRVDTALQPRETPAALPAESPEARAVLNATVARYREMKSYRDTYGWTARLEQKSEAPMEGRIDGSLAWTSGRIVNKSDVAHVYCDGRKVTWYWPAANQYVQEIQDDDLSGALHEPEWFHYGQRAAGMHPLAVLLVAGDNATESLPIVVVTDVQPTTRGGQSGRLLHGRFRVDGLPHAAALPFEAFIDDQRGLFEEFRLNYTDSYRAALRESYEGDPDAVERAEIVITLRDIECDKPIEDAAFVLNEPGARKIDMFSVMSNVRTVRPRQLLGQDAPALTGTTLDGSPFDLAAERGKTVVVAFWGTWAPQAEQMLRELQRLAAEDTPNVRIVGVGRNDAVGGPAMRGMIERCGVKFPQVNDGDGKLAEAWNVACLPLIYVVGPAGRVNRVLQSWTDDARQELSDCLPGLAGGPTTRPVDAPADPSEPDETVGFTLKVDGKPVGDARVKAETLENANVSRWNMSEQDIDGDGEAELIFPDWQGSLSILKPSTGALQRIQLMGMEATSMNSVRGVRIDGQTCWLCSGTRYRVVNVDSREGEEAVALHSPRGELLWTFRPQVDKGLHAQSQAAAGDLDGDGRVEFVIGITTQERKQIDENSYEITNMAGRLVWLDQTGQRIAERETEGSIELLHVTNAGPGKPATLLCISNGMLERYSLAPPPGGDPQENVAGMSPAGPSACMPAPQNTTAGDSGD
ncbi:MAG: TlpA family protein disulfide reductase [Phycisphaerae bacterium]|nr:TlpA family protein disulfide reductase [Phycisphaerae bacterium]